MIETHYEDYFTERKWTKIVGKVLGFCIVFIATALFIHSQYQSVANILDESGCTVRTDKDPLYVVLSGISNESEARRLAQVYFDTPLTKTDANASVICGPHYVFKSEKLEGVVVCADGRIIKTYILCPDDPFEAVRKANISAVRDITTAK